MNEPALRVALIGYGRWGKNVARVLARLADCELVMICDADPERLNGADTLGAARTTRLSEVLEHPGIQACVICTPSALHVEHALAALRAGKHVFVEKPMARSREEAHALRSLLATTGKRLMVGHIVLYHPAFHELLRVVRGGELGRLRKVTTLRSTLAQPSSDEDPWWALGPHDVSLLLALVPAAVTTISARRSLGSTGQEAVQARIAFCDGVTADVTVGRGQGRIRRVFVVGEQGAVCFRDEVRPGRVELYAAGSLEASEPTEQPLRTLPVPATEPLELELRHFVRGLLRHRPFTTDHVHGLRVTEILCAGQHSMAAAEAVPITSSALAFKQRESA